MKSIEEFRNRMCDRDVGNMGIRWRRSRWRDEGGELSNEAFLNVLDSGERARS